MPEHKPVRPAAKKEETAAACETCLYYDVIDEDGTLGCTVDIDEDDAWRERADPSYRCRMYHFYDEYKSVQKQN